MICPICDRLIPEAKFDINGYNPPDRPCFCNQIKFAKEINRLKDLVRKYDQKNKKIHDLVCV